jgi:hypothetical protein
MQQRNPSLKKTLARCREPDVLQSCSVALKPKQLPWVSQMSAAPADPVQSSTHSDTFPSRSKTPVNPGTEDWHSGMLPTGTVVVVEA